MNQDSATICATWVGGPYDGAQVNLEEDMGVEVWQDQQQSGTDEVHTLRAVAVPRRTPAGWRLFWNDLEWEEEVL